MKKSIGDLIDQLSVVNIKIFMLVDVIQDDLESDEEVGKAARKAQKLNLERSNLINAINEELGDKHTIVKM